MKDLKHLFYFENLLQEANNELVQQAKKEGKLAIGYTCFHMPEVLLNVDNCFSLRMRAPRTGSLEIATYYMSNYTCEYCRALLERAVEGGYNFLDGIAGVDACAQMNRSMENILVQKLIPGDKFFMSHVDVPYKVTEHGVEHQAEQIRTKVFQKLEENYGVDTSDEAIRKAVEEHNEICRIITEMGEYRKEDNPRITGYEFHILNLVTYVCPKYLILEKLRETLEEIKNREPDEKKNYRARVVMAGSEIDDPDFTKLVEEAGALVVADRFCFGSFPGRQEIQLGNEEDALKAVCRRYMEDSQCARYMSHEKIQARRDFVRKLYEDYHADGIIYEQLKFCDYWGYERALVSHIMQEEYQLPVLSVDRPYRAGSSGQMRTRIQAFVERMEIKKSRTREEAPSMDKKIEELLEKGKEIKNQGQDILKKERKTVSRAFQAWKDMDHHKGDVHTGELTTAFREWRGVKDTAYDFAKWLQVWGDMSLMIMKNPVGSVKGLWKYRWFSSYLQTPMFIDAQLTGLRGPQLRIAREHMRMIVRFCTRLLENTFKADENLNGPNALSDKIVLFDEMMPIHIMAGFPNLIGMPSQMAPVYITSLLDQQMQVHYLDETENYGLPADVCPLPSAEAGCGIAGDYPVFGKCYITSSMPCDGSVMTNIFQDRYFKLPTYPLTLPVRYLDEQAVDYAVEEIKGMIRFIEENTGETFDWDAYFEAMERYNRETEYEQEKWDVNQTAYPQITGSILAIYRELSYMADAGRDPRFLKTDEKVNKIMMKAYREKNPCAKEMRHRAVVWSCPAHYYANFGNWAEQCWGIDVLIDMESMMSMKFIDTEDKEESLKDIAWTYERMAMRKHTNGGYANVLDELWKVCEQFHADMVIMYSHISCKTMAGLQGLFDDQARERGIRFIWVEHDLMDPRTVSRRHMRESVNRYMRTVMHEEPVDPSLEDFDDEKEW